MLAAARTSGADMDRLDADLKADADEITALLRRSLAQANSLGLQGTPAYLIGHFKVMQALPIRVSNARRGCARPSQKIGAARGHAAQTRSSAGPLRQCPKRLA